MQRWSNSRGREARAAPVARTELKGDLVRSGKTRRDLLYGATAAVAAAGGIAAAWPFVDQMSPDARTRAAGDVVDVELSDLRAGQPRTARWHNLPIILVRRTDAMLAALQKPNGELADSASPPPREPPYAKNWHRSTDPMIAVLVGVCTYCRCVLRYAADDVGSYVCDCCASRYDSAGRPQRGIARLDLAVPPYDIMDGSVRIGKNPAGQIFFFESIERG